MTGRIRSNRQIAEKCAAEMHALYTAVYTVCECNAITIPHVEHDIRLFSEYFNILLSIQFRTHVGVRIGMRSINRKASTSQRHDKYCHVL